MKKKKTQKAKQHASAPALPSWLEMAFKSAGGAAPEDDDCEICRAMRANTDPSDVQRIDLGDGSVLEVVAIRNPGRPE